jgi:putative hydrolase of the HAD superfamily
VTRIRGILFDLDLTLADHSTGWTTIWPEVAARLAERFPRFDPDEFEARMVELGERHYELVLRGDIDYAEYRRRTLADVVAPWGDVDEETLVLYNDARDRAFELMRAYDDARETIDLLRGRGIKVGVLTNGLSELQRRKLRRIGLEDAFDAVAISQEIGAWKPDPRAFAAAVTMLGLQPAEVAMVGDHLENDVAGALAAGLGAAVWVERAPGEAPDGAHLARELADVPALLGLVEASATGETGRVRSS